ncbi:MAG: hypothetical protein KJ060_00485 [Candidatus Hydrogenedentes bacterium]|nr:hypothetical protein [Candidatus Hydrogenedentota bacterium]
MGSATESIFERLESAIAEWSAEIKSSSAGMTEKLARAKDRLRDTPEGAESVEALTASLDFARAEFARLEVALRECLSAAKSANERAGSAAEATDSIRDQQSALRDELSSLRNQIDEKLAALSDAWAAPPARDEELAADVDALKNQLQEVRERMETSSSGDADETLADIRAELELLRSAVMELQDAEPPGQVEDDRAGAFASELNALKAEVASLRERQDSESPAPAPAANDELVELRDDLSRLQGVLAGSRDTERRIEELEGLLAVERERSDRLEQRIAEAAQVEPPAGMSNEVAVELDMLREDLAALRAELAEVRVSPAPAAPAEVYSAPPSAPTPPPPRPDMHRATIMNLELSGFDSDGRRRRMGDILVDAGVLTQEQLEHALQEQQEHPQRRLGAILVDLGHTESEVVAQVLACQLKLPFIHLESDVPEESAVRLVNGRLCRHHHCIPVRIEDETVILAMSNPLDLIAIEDIELATSRRVDPVVAAEPDIAKAIDWFYGSEG